MDKTVNEYLEGLPTAQKQRLIELKGLILACYPKAEISIKYKLLAFTLKDGFLYLGAFKNHIGIYPIYQNSVLEEEIKPYRAKGTKNSFRIKHTQEVPTLLLKKMILAKLSNS